MFMKKLRELSEISNDGVTDVVALSHIEALLQEFDVTQKDPTTIADFPVCNENTDHQFVNKGESYFIIRVSKEVYSTSYVLDEDFIYDTSYTVEDGAEDKSGCFMLLLRQIWEK